MQLVRKVWLAMFVLLLTSLATVSNAQKLSLKSGKLASLLQRGKQLVAGVGAAAILCTSAGCASKRMVDGKYDKILPVATVASFGTSVALGVLAGKEKVPTSAAWGSMAAYATFFYLGYTTEYDYGKEGLRAKSGGVDWYGMNNELYSSDLVFGVRMDGQEQFNLRQPELEPYNYQRVLAHIHYNGRDYAAVVTQPHKFRRHIGPPYGFRVRIRHPSHRPPPPKPSVTVVDSLQPHKYHRIPLDSVMGIYLTDHPDYEHDEWVVIEEGERLLYGKIAHHFSSGYAQVKILAVKEGDNGLVMLPAGEPLYSVYQQKLLQRPKYPLGDMLGSFYPQERFQREQEVSELR